MKICPVCTAIVLAFSACNPARADWNSTIAASSPLNWYQLNETSGPTAFDHGSQGLHGTYGGGAAAPTRGVTGLVGTAVEFGGLTQNIRLDGAPLTGDWSAEFVVKKTADLPAEVLLRGVDILTPSTGLMLDQFPGTHQIGYVQFAVEEYTFSPAVFAPLNEFIDLVFVKRSSGMELYVDGVFAGSNPITIDLHRIWIGDARTDPLMAVLDEVVIYNRALSGAEIAAHFQSVPEPSSIALATIGMTLLSIQFRRRLRRPLRAGPC